MQASQHGVAAVGRAGVAILARARDVAAAEQRIARVDCADIAVVTGQGLTRHTAEGGIAGLDAVAAVEIVADERLAGATDAAAASFLTVADVTVRAGSRVVHVEAACARIAQVIGAHVAVVTVGV